MNKRFRCAIAAALVLVLLASAFIVFPSRTADDKTAAVASEVYTGDGQSRPFAQRQNAGDDNLSESGFDAEPLDELNPDGTEPSTDPAGDPDDGTGIPVADVTDATEPVTTDPTTDATDTPTDPATEPIGEESTDTPTDPASEAPTDSSTDAPTEAPTKAVTEVPTEAPDELGEVTDISRTDPAQGVISLKWNTASGAQGYHVYWRDADAASDSYSLLSSVKDTSLTIRNLKKGSMYFFKVVPYRSQDGALIDGYGIALKAGTAPVGPTSFYLASGVPTGTLLKWGKVSGCDGYVLYRQFDGKWSRYKELDKNTTEFRDTNVTPGRAYNYKLCTYRTDSRGKLESSALLVRTICGLCAPVDNGTTTLLRKMYFKWTKNQYANGYEIRYSSDNKNFKLLVDTKSTTYTSNRFIDGKHYYFRIYPYHYIDNKKTKIYGTYLAKDLTIRNSAFGKTVPKTYIEVSLNDQHMWYYINGELYVSTPVVTGNYNDMDTPRGYWSVNSKASPCTLVGDGYVSYVDYWMAFIGSGYGIHDASWRSEFGGQIYKGNGSHGCINTPFSAVKKMYAKVTVGTPVIVY